MAGCLKLGAGLVVARGQDIRILFPVFGKTCPLLKTESSNKQTNESSETTALLACLVTCPVQDITKGPLVPFGGTPLLSVGFPASVVAQALPLQLHRAACPLWPSVRHWEQMMLQRCEGLHCALEAIPFSRFAAAVSDCMP